MKFNKKYAIRVLLLYIIVIIGASIPIISVAIASYVSNYCGCTLNEGSVHPCQLFGYEIGELLYSMFVFGWLSLATIPIGLVLLLALTIFSIINYKKFIDKN